MGVGWGGGKKSMAEPGESGAIERDMEDIGAKHELVDALRLVRISLLGIDRGRLQVLRQVGKKKIS